MNVSLQGAVSGMPRARGVRKGAAAGVGDQWLAGAGELLLVSRGRAVN
ncbi:MULTISPECIES: hypothetical protein [Streptomyces]|nr:hypothetical protein [Streptomyces sp. ScaeMP-e48]WST13436.1 hypothetical protein OG721_05390 [Streptomyces microflavus]SCK26767.1 hypothetical protein YUYDRAFT_02953 [Streptomyces sp. ScaeMP-e48]